MSPPKILFVCLGNICRSPTAEAVFRRRARESGLDVEIDSAGTSAWHEGEAPDPRSREAGEARGYSFAGQASRAVSSGDFAVFNYILAMDEKNLRDLKKECPSNFSGTLELFLNYAKAVNVREVPDPYHGGAGGFQTVLDLIEAASDGLIAELSLSGATDSKDI